MKAIFAVVLMIASPAYAQTELETLLCIGEKSTGFKYMNNQWQDVIFNLNEDRYIVAPTNEIGDYTITKIGDRNIVANCNRLSLGENKFWSRMNCGGTLSSFAFNFDNMRFQRYFGFGYIEGEDEAEANTPYITIGRCSIIPK